MNIEITSKKSEGLERLLEVTVPVEDVRGAEEKAARRYARQVRLPGFRPGKAPAAMVRKKFADAIRQEALESLVQEAFKEVLEREKFDLATQPHVHDLKFTDGEPLTFELHLEVRPNIEIPRATGFRVERKVRPVTDEQLQEQLNELREDKAIWTPVDEKPMPGDMVTVQLAIPEDAASDATAEPREYRIVLGTGQALPAIEEVITETAPGATTERPVKWPEDFPDEEQRGKTKTVRVTVEDVKRKSLPELDDEFARATGDFESIDALRSTVRGDLVNHAEREADAEVRQKLVDEIIAANPFDIPQSWVTRLVDAYLDTYQIPEEDRERFRGEFRPLAERQVRRDLVVGAIAKKEGLEASEADIDERVMEVAEKRGTEPGQVYASLEKAGRIGELERNITEEKVFAWLMEKNTVE